MVEPTIPQSPREQILAAVITCIEKYGIDNVTTRKIAEEAGTNIASINYYFRSKDLAVAEALGLALRNSNTDIRAIVTAEDQSFEQVLETMLTFLIEGGMRYPGVTMAHMYPVLMEKRFDAPGGHLYRGMVELLAARAVRDYPAKPQAAIHMALTQVLSAATFAMLAPGMFQPLTSIDLTRPGGPHMLAHYLTQMFVRGLDILTSG